MALTKIPRGLLDTGIADSSDATAITIDSSENVAIANGALAVGQATFSGSSVLADFHGSGSGVGAQLAFANDHNTDKFYVGLEGNTTGDGFLYQQKDADINFYTNNAFRAKLDNEGDFAVGSVTTLLRLQSVNSGTGSLPTDGTVGITAANANIPFGVHNESNSATYSGIAFETRTSGAARWLIANEWKSQYLGDLVFSRRTGGTSSAEAMRIDSAGKVGIGTTSPTAILHIEVADNTEFLKATITGQEQWAFKGASGSGSTDYVSFGISGGTQAMAWQEDGKVGIGETTPLGQFHVKTADSGATADASADEGVFENSGNAGISILSGASNTGSIYFGDSGTNWDGYIAYSQATRSMTLGTAAGGRVYIKSDGKVGIGVAAPGGLPLQTKVASGDNKLRMTTANKDAFILELKDASGDVHLGTNTTAGALVIADGGDITTPANPVFIAYGGGSGWTTLNGVVHLETPGGSSWNEVYDRGGNFDHTNGRFTAPVTGYYLFVFHSYTRANDTSGYVYPNFYVGSNLWQNGSNTMIQHYVGHGDEDYGIANTAHIYLTANQYVRVGYSQHGNSNSISYHSNSLGFSGHLIG